MSEQYSNVAKTTNTGTLDGTTNPIAVVVNTGDGALFPATTNGPFRITVCDATGTNAEVMLVTTRATDTFTATRGAWSVTAGTPEVPVPSLSTHSAGSIVVHGITAGAMNGIRADEVQTGTGALPTVFHKGDLWIPTSEPVIQLATDTTSFASWGPLFPFTRPVDPGIWVNQNPAGSTDTVATSSAGGIVILSKVGGDGNGNITARVKAVLASKSYTFTIAMTMGTFPSNFAACGLILTNGTLGGSSAIVFGPQFASGAYNLLISKFTTMNVSFSASYQSYATTQVYGPLWLRVVEDATNRTFYVSDNGQTWSLIQQTVNTDFLTSTHYGIFTRGGASTTYTNVTLYSLKETNP
jgi:hypothetical protein